MAYLLHTERCEIFICTGSYSEKREGRENRPDLYSGLMAETTSEYSSQSDLVHLDDYSSKDSYLVNGFG